jgi:1,6-anhydro-N-acetylmuramate kinase
MSGTSLDGVDVALIETDSERIAQFEPTGYRPFSDHEQDSCGRHCKRAPPRPTAPQAYTAARRPSAIGDRRRGRMVAAIDRSVSGLRS